MSLRKELKCTAQFGSQQGALVTGTRYEGREQKGNSMRNVLLICVLGVVGCGITPHSAIDWPELEGRKLLYFEQGDRLPKDVMLVQHKDTNGRMTMTAIPFEVYAELIKQGLITGTDVVRAYTSERQNEGYISRRILVRGYETNELQDVVKIIDAFNRCLERWDGSAPVQPLVNKP